MKVQATAAFDYAGIERKPKDIFDIEDNHFLPLNLCQKVVKAEEAAEQPAPRSNRYKRRDLRADE